MLNEKIHEAMNVQINKELYSEYLYLSMASYFDAIGLKGFANWMRVQVKEERTHALMMYTYVNDAGGRVKLAAIDGPPTDWDTPLGGWVGVHGRGGWNDWTLGCVAVDDFAFVRNTVTVEVTLAEGARIEPFQPANPPPPTTSTP